MTEKNLYKDKPAEVKEGTVNRSTENHGSAIQGGSDFGQGSHQLGAAAQKQGSVKGRGTDYKDEAGWNNEALRGEDQPETKP